MIWSASLHIVVLEGLTDAALARDQKVATRVSGFIISLKGRILATRAGHFLALLLTLVATGCASTTLTNSWRDPNYEGLMTSMVVVGVSKQASVRRVFEDEFAAQLRSRGIRAVPSYTLIAEDGPVEESRLRAAVESANTNAVILTRLVKVDRTLTVSPSYPPLMYDQLPYYYGFYSRAWLGYYEPPIVQQYDVVTAETTVFARGRADPVWSGTTETFAPGKLKKETSEFAMVVMDALAAEGLI